MEIRIYNSDLDLQGIIENQTSLLWTRKYYEAGEFELHAPITDDNIKLLKIGNLVSMHGQDDAGIIEDIEYEENSEGNEITAQGRFLSAYMDYRLIRGTVNLNETVEVAMRRLLSEATAIPRVELDSLQGFAKKVTGQVTYKNLLSFMTKLAKYGTLGYRFKPDFTAKKIIFEIYQGKDRSVEQTDNSRVIFSENYDNLNQVTYRANDQSYANVAYVIGKDANEAEVLVTVGDLDSTGLDRREVYVDGTSVSATDLSESEFLAALKQEGQNTLNADCFSETFECETNAAGNFNYREHYDLGDVVTVRKSDWGMQKSLRITELLETYEYGSMTVTPTLGTPLPTSIDWED